MKSALFVLFCLCAFASQVSSKHLQKKSESSVHYFETFLKQAKEKYETVLKSFEAIVVDVSKTVTTFVTERTVEFEEFCDKFEKQIDYLKGKGESYKKHVDHYQSELKKTQQNVHVEVKKCSTVAVETAEKYTQTCRKTASEIKVYISKYVELFKSCVHTKLPSAEKCVNRKRDKFVTLKKKIEVELQTLIEQTIERRRYIYTEATKCVKNVYDAAQTNVKKLGYRVKKDHY